MRRSLLAALLTSLALPMAAQAQDVVAERNLNERAFDRDGGPRTERSEAFAERMERRAAAQTAPAPEQQLAQRGGGDRGQWRNRGGGGDGPRREGRGFGGGNIERPQSAAPVLATPQTPRTDWRANREARGGGDWQANREARGNRDWRGDGNARRDWGQERREGFAGQRNWDNNRREATPDRRNWDQNRRFDDGRRDRWQSNRNANRGWNDGRGWQSDRNWTGNRNWGRDRDWNRNWRQDNRYDWRGYRNYNRQAFRLPRYYAPYGWNQGYRRFGIGAFLTQGLFAQNYWIADPWDYRLPPVDWPFQWVRYYNDALLVDTETGEVVDVIEGIFW